MFLSTIIPPTSAPSLHVRIYPHLATLLTPTLAMAPLSFFFLSFFFERECAYTCACVSRGRRERAEEGAEGEGERILTDPTPRAATDVGLNLTIMT